MSLHPFFLLSRRDAEKPQRLRILKLFKNPLRSFRHRTVELNLTRNHEVACLILGLARGLGIQHCPELQCRLQTQFGSQVAVAVAWASSCSSD